MSTTIDPKEKDSKMIPRRVTGGVKARGLIPSDFSHMSNKGGAGIIALLDDFCGFLSLEPVYGYNLLSSGS